MLRAAPGDKPDRKPILTQQLAVLILVVTTLLAYANAWPDSLTFDDRLNGGLPLVKAITDVDGFYFLNYKHKGKAVYYHVELWNGNTLLAETPNGIDNPGGVPLQASGFAEQNFSDDDNCGVLNTGWMPKPYEITKGKFKTIE